MRFQVYQHYNFIIFWLLNISSFQCTFFLILRGNAFSSSVRSIRHAFIYFISVHKDHVWFSFSCLGSLECRACSNVSELALCQGHKSHGSKSEKSKEARQISHFYLKSKYIIFSQNHIIGLDTCIICFYWSIWSTMF